MRFHGIWRRGRRLLATALSSCKSIGFFSLTQIRNLKRKWRTLMKNSSFLAKKSTILSKVRSFFRSADFKRQKEHVIRQDTGEKRPTYKVGDTEPTSTAVDSGDLTAVQGTAHNVLEGSITPPDLSQEEHAKSGDLPQNIPRDIAECPASTPSNVMSAADTSRVQQKRKLNFVQEPFSVQDPPDAKIRQKIRKRRRTRKNRPVHHHVAEKGEVSFLNLETERETFKMLDIEMAETVEDIVKASDDSCIGSPKTIGPTSEESQLGTFPLVEKRTTYTVGDSDTTSTAVDSGEFTADQGTTENVNEEPITPQDLSQEEHAKSGDLPQNIPGDIAECPASISSNVMSADDSIRIQQKRKLNLAPEPFSVQDPPAAKIRQKIRKRRRTRKNRPVHHHKAKKGEVSFLNLETERETLKILDIEMVETDEDIVKASDDSPIGSPKTIGPTSEDSQPGTFPLGEKKKTYTVGDTDTTSTAVDIGDIIAEQGTAHNVCEGPITPQDLSQEEHAKSGELPQNIPTDNVQCTPSKVMSAADTTRIQQKRKLNFAPEPFSVQDPPAAKIRRKSRKGRRTRKNRPVHHHVAEKGEVSFLSLETERETLKMLDIEIAEPDEDIVQASGESLIGSPKRRAPTSEDSQPGTFPLGEKRPTYKAGYTDTTSTAVDSGEFIADQGSTESVNEEPITPQDLPQGEPPQNIPRDTDECSPSKVMSVADTSRVQLERKLSFTPELLIVEAPLVTKMQRKIHKRRRTRHLKRRRPIHHHVAEKGEVSFLNHETERETHKTLETEMVEPDEDIVQVSDDSPIMSPIRRTPTSEDSQSGTFPPAEHVSAQMIKDLGNQELKTSPEVITPDSWTLQNMSSLSPEHLCIPRQKDNIICQDYGKTRTTYTVGNTDSMSTAVDSGDLTAEQRSACNVHEGPFTPPDLSQGEHAKSGELPQNIPMDIAECPVSTPSKVMSAADTSRVQLEKTLSFTPEHFIAEYPSAAKVQQKKCKRRRTRQLKSRRPVLHHLAEKGEVSFLNHETERETHKMLDTEMADLDEGIVKASDESPIVSPKRRTPTSDDSQPCIFPPGEKTPTYKVGDIDTTSTSVDSGEPTADQGRAENVNEEPITPQDLSQGEHAKSGELPQNIPRDTDECTPSKVMSVVDISRVQLETKLNFVPEPFSVQDPPAAKIRQKTRRRRRTRKNRLIQHHVAEKGEVSFLDIETERETLNMLDTEIAEPDEDIVKTSDESPIVSPKRRTLTFEDSQLGTFPPGEKTPTYKVGNIVTTSTSVATGEFTADQGSTESVNEGPITRQDLSQGEPPQNIPRDTDECTPSKVMSVIDTIRVQLERKLSLTPEPFIVEDPSAAIVQRKICKRRRTRQHKRRRLHHLAEKGEVSFLNHETERETHKTLDTEMVEPDEDIVQASHESPIMSPIRRTPTSEDSQSGTFSPAEHVSAQMIEDLGNQVLTTSPEAITPDSWTQQNMSNLSPEHLCIPRQKDNLICQDYGKKRPTYTVGNTDTMSTAVDSGDITAEQRSECNVHEGPITPQDLSPDENAKSRKLPQKIPRSIAECSASTPSNAISASDTSRMQQKRMLRFPLETSNVQDPPAAKMRQKIRKRQSTRKNHPVNHHLAEKSEVSFLNLETEGVTLKLLDIEITEPDEDIVKASGESPKLSPSRTTPTSDSQPGTFPPAKTAAAEHVSDPVTKDLGHSELRRSPEVMPPNSWRQQNMTILSPEHLSILKSRGQRGMLDDGIINKAQELLQSHFQGFDGLQPTAALLVPGYSVHRKAVQIHYDEERVHWLTTCFRNGKILVADSINDNYLSPSIREQINNIYGEVVQEPLKHVQFLNVDQQKNNYDCGVFAIAFAFELLTDDGNPTAIYKHGLMRKHLISCLQKGRITAFPKIEQK